MEKPLLAVFLIAVIIGGFAVVSSINLSSAQSGTSVNGIISQDTTWTKANSPYILTAPLAVAQGVSLTMEPGVIVNFNNLYLQVNGILSVKGTNSEPVQFNDGQITFASKSANWNERANFGCLIENANLIRIGIQINDSSPKINNNYILGAISISGGSPIISNNKLTTFSEGALIEIKSGSPIIVKNDFSTQVYEAGNPATNFGIYIENSTNAYISDNTIGHLSQAGIYAGSGSAVIQRNKIYDGIIGGLSLVIQNNTITGIGIKSPSTLSTIIYNNIIGYGVYLTGSEDINASYNWWGTADPQVINQSIYDFKNDFNLGIVNFVPFLTEPNPQAMPDPNAPIPTPIQLQSPAPSSTPSPSPSIPEFPTWIILPMLIMTVSLFAAIRKKHYLET